MAINTTVNPTTSFAEKNAWSTLYPWLFPRVKHWVTNSGVIIWTKQTDDVSSDITQEAITRVISTMAKAEREHTPPIASLKAFSLIVARNYFKDLRRKEARLIHLDPSPSSVNEQSEQNLVLIFEEDTVERLINHLFMQEIVIMLANIIADLPGQQQEAILVTLAADLPTQTIVQGPLTLLQQALADRGLPLQNYQYGKPADECMRKRFAANLHAAKQQVAKRYRAMHNADHKHSSNN